MGDDDGSGTRTSCRPEPSVQPSESWELLRVLADELVALKFDTKAFLRELTLSQTYQRSIDLPASFGSRKSEIASALAELKTHTDALAAACKADKSSYDQAIKTWHKEENSLVPIAAELDQASAKYAAASKTHSDAEKVVNGIRAKIAQLEDLAKTLAEAGAKAEEAAKKLQNEKDLAAAAQKFVDRSKKTTAEIAAQQALTTEKTATLKKAADGLVAAAKPVEAARTKSLPVREVVREKERIVLAARKKMSESQIAFERHKKRVRLLEAYTERIELEEKALASAKFVNEKRAAVAQSEKLAREHETLTSLRICEVKAADQERAVAEAAAKEAKSALGRQQKIESKVVEALKATELALQQLPKDPALTEASQRLKTKADELRLVSDKMRADFDRESADSKKLVGILVEVTRHFEEATAEKTRLTSAVSNAQAALDEETASSKSLASELAAATDLLASLLADDFQLAQLKPLSPEHMCWSILKVTGVYDRTRQSEEAELNKTKPLKDEARSDPAQLRARAVEIEDRSFAKLKANLPAFVRVYATGAGQPQGDFFATADQALFVANAGLVNGWINPAAGSISERLVQEKDTAKAAEALYLTILSRRPSDAETAEVVRTFAEPDANKPSKVHSWVWGLLTSAEFRFNH